ncbi:peroxisome proliferator-activated receptor gamma coactivator-related protein 1-like [Oncorhynchus masou masou]|uniref:peroxisome proliferator-activated receptor gamma coactivator-related protein 1-like n=1 Tax=Oncorhynchus masou masou TaxID=90313 RepID=UPI003183AC9E
MQQRQTILPDHQPIPNPSSVPGTQNSGKYLRQQQPVDSRTVPETQLPSDSAPPSTESSPSRTDAITAGETQEERTSPCIPPPSPSPPSRGRRSSRRYRTRSSCSDSSSRSPSSSSSSSSSSSRSRSRTPPRKRFCPRRSESSSSSSCSSSVSRSPVPCRYRLPYPQSWNRSRSTSQSWTQSGSRSRSRSPTTLAYSRAQRWRDCYSSNNIRDSRKRKRQQDMRSQKLKAIDERRVVYVGRIQRTMMHAELRERFSLFGEVEECTLHCRDRG